MIVIYVILLSFSILVLNFYFKRRLGKFPPGLPYLPIIGSVPFIKFPIYKGLKTLARTYGDIFSVHIGSYEMVVINNWKLAREAYSDSRFSGRPPLQIFKDRSFGKQRGIFFGTEKLWMEQRRFTVKHLRDFGFSSSKMENIIMTEVNDAILELRKTLGESISVEFILNCATLNALWSIIANKRYEHGDPRLNRVVDIIYKIFSDLDKQGPITFLPWLTRLAPRLSGWESIMSGLKNCFDFLEEIVNEHRETLDYSNPRDFIDLYLNKIKETDDETSSFYQDEGEIELLIVLLDLFVAATDTVTTTLNWAFLYLITHPHEQIKLHAEIDEQIGKTQNISLAHRSKMPYMEAFIAETLRISSVGTIFPHSTIENVDFNGFYLPKGTIVFANLWGIHHDEAYWGDPFNFRPQRFLNDKGEFQSNKSLLAFSYGKRVCPGENMARDELFLFLCGILQKLEVRSAETNPNLNPTETVVPRPYKYKVIFSDR